MNFWIPSGAKGFCPSTVATSRLPMRFEQPARRHGRCAHLCTGQQEVPPTKFTSTRVPSNRLPLFYHVLEIPVVRAEAGISYIGWLASGEGSLQIWKQGTPCQTKGLPLWARHCERGQVGSWKAKNPTFIGFNGKPLISQKVKVSRSSPIAIKKEKQSIEGVPLVKGALSS